MSIYNSIGDECVIKANHGSQVLRGNQVHLVTVTFNDGGGSDMYALTELLSADGGWEEILEAVKKAQNVPLDKIQVAKALKSI